MTTVWFLIVLFNGGYKYGAAVDHIPFQTLQACEAAADKIQLGNKRGDGVAKAFCVAGR